MRSGCSADDFCEKIFQLTGCKSQPPGPQRMLEHSRLILEMHGFLLTDFFAKQTKFCIVLTRPEPVPVSSYMPQFRSSRHARHVITWLLISLSWSIGISSRWIRGLTHSARLFFRQVLAVNDLHQEQGKTESLWRSYSLISQQMSAK